MAKSVNQTILLGRLTKDVDLRATSSGKQVASFSLAVDKMANQEGADFFDVVAWEKLAELMQQYTSKGSKVLVMGRLQQQTWEDKDGNKRSKVVITANDVTFLDNKTSGGQTEDKVVTDIGDEPVNLDDIPF